LSGSNEKLMEMLRCKAGKMGSLDSSLIDCGRWIID